MMKSYLCVGGPLAGQKYDTKDNNFRVPIRKTKSTDALPITNEPAAAVAAIETIVYVEETFHTAHGSIMFWIPQGQTWFDTMVLLLESYELTAAAIAEVNRLKRNQPKKEK